MGQVFADVPSINTNRVETQVLVDNGQTVVLGGIFTTDKNISDDEDAVPWRSAVRRAAVQAHASSGTTSKSCLIFITPRIIQDALVN